MLWKLRHDNDYWSESPTLCHSHPHCYLRKSWWANHNVQHHEMLKSMQMHHPKFITVAIWACLQLLWTCQHVRKLSASTILGTSWMSQDDDDEQKTNWQKDIILWNIGKLTWGFVASSAHVCTNMIRAFWKFSSTWRMALVVAMASTSALPHPWWYILLPLSWQQVNYYLPKSSAQSTDLSMKMQPWISMFKPSRSMSWCQWRFGFDTKFSNSQPQHKWVSKSLELLLLHMLQQTTSHRDSIKRRSKWVLSISNGNNWNSLAHNRFIHQETFWGEKKWWSWVELKKLKLLLPTKWPNSQPQHNWVYKSLELILLHLLQQTTSPQGFSQKKIQVGPSISNWNSLTHNRYFHQETFWREFRQNGNLGLNSRNWNYFYLQNE
jgi:hypothetical protein